MNGLLIFPTWKDIASLSDLASDKFQDWKMMGLVARAGNAQENRTVTDLTASSGKRPEAERPIGKLH
ncbi:hypothetical protein J2X47_000486 [Sphingomonas sp. BE270]|jgi:hypothetical protein|uniref:hypothetical protein n=1 Tax=Sphingomonas sp. BE270 TaxID=2817726 RepID=UPI002862E923|nr:hypothetical protein [Sphingomonas sp. BE270]MDR7256325.1 hypothetical protein [Sphingomonas sp. BE270]